MAGPAVAWVMAEPGRAGGAAASLALLLAARVLAGTVEAVHWGPDASGVATALGPYGTARVLTAGDLGPVLPAMAVTAAMARRMADHGCPEAVLFSATCDQQEIAARLSARLDRPLTTGVLGLRRTADGVVVDRSAGPPCGPGGGVETVRLDGPTPHLLMLRPSPPVGGRRPSPVPGSGPSPVEALDVPAVGAVPVVRGHTRRRAGEAPPALGHAAVVVAGGRGLGDAVSFRLVDRLARLLGGAPAATGGAVAAGWAPEAWKIGQTAVTVRPRLYLAFGISGASQHMAGVRGGGHVVAVDRDPAAPSLAAADLAVVGDARQVLSRLVDRLGRQAAAPQTRGQG